MPMPCPPDGPLDQFCRALEASDPLPEALAPLLPALEASGQLETALNLLKRRHPAGPRGADADWGPLRRDLEVRVARTRERRMATWQLDARRRTLRLAIAVEGPACQLNPSALAGTLAGGFLAAGLPLAMGLEKHPRPLVTLGAPLPVGVPGEREWADVVLREPLGFPLEVLADRLAPALPGGLRLLEAREVPSISSPVSDLCELSRWTWHCPESLLATARPRLEAFAAATTWEIQKAGKQGGQKVLKATEVRSLVSRLHWDGTVLHFDTRMRLPNATSPAKLLGGVLGCDPALITGLRRVALELGEDPRLRDAYRFETKLSNLYEDAVLLDCGPGPVPEAPEDEDTLLL